MSTLVVGTSHAEMGIAAPQFSDPAYNMAFSCQDPWYDRELVRYYLRRAPALRRLVLEVDSTTVRLNTNKGAPGVSWRQGLYHAVFGIRARVDDERFYNPITLAAIPEGRGKIGHMKDKKDWADDKNRGWPPMMSKAIDPALGATQAKAVQDFPPGLHPGQPADPDRRGEAVPAEGRGRGAGVGPTHATYHDSLSPAVRAEGLAAAREIGRATGVPHLDYEEDPRFAEADFYDSHHLGTAGAIKFGKILEGDLNRVCPLPKK